MDQLLYTINQCCRLAAIGRTKFYELIASGEIPVRKVGKKTLVAAVDLKRWAERLPGIEAKTRALGTARLDRNDLSYPGTRSARGGRGGR